ncbi:hypothetical protein [Streptomyces sennicomposti]|uniref:hypothetical protein n=1 Tax=Streptomyces sennicomposti TaxID=2873384 RepID=UPI001CA64049|nr:hypothetical protein [Streptomyces sennicomposti]MBY8869742.1 hypothetical protein [Streptomyces sennicomposti]
MDGHDEHSKPGIGDLAKDTAKNQVGFLMDEVGGKLLPRPTRGGKEWEADPGDVESPTALEEMRARNNVRSEMRRLGL